MRRQQMPVFVLALVLVAAACGGDNADGSDDDDCDLPAALDTVGQLTVATGETGSAPWVENGDPSSGRGFEPALVIAIADELGLDVVNWTTTSAEDAVAPGPKDFDFSIQQHRITEDADEVVDLSIAYYQVEQAVVGSPDNAVADATSLSALSRLQLGAMSGTNSLDYIESEIAPDDDPFVFDDISAARDAFEAGRVDGIVVGLPTAYTMTTGDVPGASIIFVLPRLDEEPEEFGIVFPDASPLVPCIDDALAALRDEGILAELEEEWLRQGGQIPSLGA